MSVYNILQLAQGKMGMNPADAGERKVLLRFLNEAAYEIYMQSDMTGSLMEQVFKVNGDQTIALPSYVGYLRAVREYSTFIPWQITQMRPRYNQSNWQDFWRNWQLKNKQALQKSVTNQSIVAISVPQLDTPPLSVTVTGPTPTATSVSQVVLLDSATPLINGVYTKQTQNLFLDITAFTKQSITTYDVTLSDVDGNILSVIPNNEFAASYQIVDISTCPWLQISTNPLDHYVEVLFKQKLPILSNDGDEFPAQNCDHILANKMIQIWLQEQGNVQEALAYDQLTTRSLARMHEEQNRATEDVVALVENYHDNLQPRIRSRRPARYGGYSTTTRYGTM